MTNQQQQQPISIEWGRVVFLPSRSMVLATRVIDTTQVQAKVDANSTRPMNTYLEEVMGTHTHSHTHSHQLHQQLQLQLHQQRQLQQHHHDDRELCACVWQSSAQAARGMHQDTPRRHTRKIRPHAPSVGTACKQGDTASTGFRNAYAEYCAVVRPHVRLHCSAAEVAGVCRKAEP
jgi:hypothetical protein